MRKDGGENSLYNFQYMLSNLADDELMKLVLSGNNMAFAELFDRHSALLFGYCLRILGGNRALAEDIAQDVWLKIAKEAPRYEARGQFKAWIMRIAHNETITQIRRLSHQSYEPVSDQDEPSDDFSAEEQMLQQNDSRVVHNAIEALPESQRMALMLTVIEGLSQEEIAAKMGGTVVSVKSLVYRARLELRRKLRRE